MSNQNAGATWYFRRGGRQIGPLTWEELAALSAAAKIVPSDEVSSDGATWSAAAGVAGLPFSGGNTLDYDVPRERPTVMTGYACDMLVQTSPYARIMSVLMFLAAGLMVVAPLLLETGEAAMGSSAHGAAYVCVSFTVAVLYVIPAVFLSQYASNARRFGKLRESRALERALRAQKSFWKFMAIFAIVVVLIYVVLIALGFVMWSMAYRV
ncbi:MAG TPA: GYF domain-containing protein [Phycisphaerae bacterium]|nr:GYF domain-containing protein [Phycisphaerae bacterium]